MEIEYQGDPRQRPITSTENATLVRLTYRLGNFLQERLQLDQPPNLRSLASYKLYLAVIAALVGLFLLWQFANLLTLASLERNHNSNHRRYRV